MPARHNGARPARRTPSELRFGLGLFITLDAIDDLALSRRQALPATHLHPLAGLQIFVVLKEGLDLEQALGLQISGCAPAIEGSIYV